MGISFFRLRLNEFPCLCFAFLTNGYILSKIPKMGSVEVTLNWVRVLKTWTTQAHAHPYLNQIQVPPPS